MPGGLSAQPYRAPPVETEFFTGDTTRFRVIAVAPDGVTTENASKARAIWLGGLVTRDLAPEDRARLMEFFPLKVGERFAYLVSSANGTWQHDLAVEAADTLQLDGKAVPVYRVKRHEKGVPPNRFEGEYTAWYAPDYGFPLKLSYRHIAGDKPNFADWQVIHIVPAGSVDGMWRLEVNCSNGAFIRFARVLVRNGAVISRGGQPSWTSVVDSDLTLVRAGEQIELKGSSMSAGGAAVIVSARGVLVGRSLSGTGTINTTTGCPFSGERL
jgi:hypothetical protein